MRRAGGSGVEPRGRASVLLSDGRWFNSPGLQSVFWQDTESQTAPDVLVGTLHGSHRHQCMNVLYV